MNKSLAFQIAWSSFWAGFGFACVAMNDGVVWLHAVFATAQLCFLLALLARHFLNTPDREVLQ